MLLDYDLVEEDETYTVNELSNDVNSVLLKLLGISSVCLAGALTRFGNRKTSVMNYIVSGVTRPLVFTEPVRLHRIDEIEFDLNYLIFCARGVVEQGSQITFDLKLEGGDTLFSLPASDGYVVDLQEYILPRVSSFIFDRSSMTEGGDAAAFAKLLAFPGFRLGPACTSIKLQRLDLSSAAANEFVSSFLLPGGGSAVSTLEVELPRGPAGPLPPALVSAMPTFTSLRTLLLTGRLSDAVVVASFAAALAALPQDLPLQSLSILSVDGRLLLEPLLAVPLVRRLAREGRLRISFAVRSVRHCNQSKHHLRQLVEAGARRLNLALQGLHQHRVTPEQREAARSQFDSLISGFLAKCRRKAASAVGGGGDRARKPSRGSECGGSSDGSSSDAPGKAAPTPATVFTGGITAAAGEGGATTDGASASSSSGGVLPTLPAPPPRLLVSLHLTTYEPTWKVWNKRHEVVTPGLKFPLTEAKCELGGLFFSTVYTKC